MDRSWINSRLFSKKNRDGVNEFMKFVSEKFGEDEEMRCLCRHCLNQVYGHKGIVEDHLFIHGMCSTHDRWIYHGEASDAGVDDKVGHLDEPIGFSEDVGMNEEEKDPGDDRIHEMVEELYIAEQEDVEVEVDRNLCLQLY
jgi:hypothetical protein